MSVYTVGYFVGSLATASINRKLALALVAIGAKELALREIPFGDLPLYTYDYDANFPSCRARIQGRDRVGRRRVVRHAGIQPLHPRAR